MTEDYRQEQENLDEQREEKPARRDRVTSFFKRLVVLLLAMTVVLGAVAVMLLGEGKYLDQARRWVVYGKAEEENLYAFAADGNNRYGMVGDFLVVLNQNDMQFLGSDGTAYQSKAVQMSSPALDVGGKLAVAYDIGGQNLLVLGVDGVKLEIALEEDYGIIAADLNAADYLTVVAQQSGYKGAVTVYNEKMEKVFAYRSSSRFLIDAAVTEDCSAVSVVALGQGENDFCSQVLRYRLNETEYCAETILDGHLTLEIENSGDGCVSLSDNEIAFTDAGGACLGAFTFGDLYLRDYALGGEDFATVLLNRYRSGSIGTLVNVGGDGKAIAMKDITDEVLDISAAGEYVAVLYGERLVIYNRNLEEYSVLEDTDYAGNVIMNADGSAVIISGNSARRYLP